MIGRWKRREAAPPSAQRLRGLLAFQADAGTSRAVSLCAGLDDVRVLGSAAYAGGFGADAARDLARRLGAEGLPAILVTPEARSESFDARVPRPGGGGPQDPGPGSLPRLRVRFDDGRRLEWSAACAAAGLALLGIYPRLGSAASAWPEAAEGARRRVVQVESDGLAVAEFEGPRCVRLSVFDEDPAGHRFARWIGDGWPEVWLCGGWPGLDDFGYELARSGRTWARLRELDGAGIGLPASLAAVVGAARHALGLSAPDAIPWSGRLGER